jgi:acylglycerol lipase
MWWLTALQVTDPKASQQFYEEVKANDKSFELVNGSFHEIHNEPEFKVKLLENITTYVPSF